MNKLTLLALILIGTGLLSGVKAQSSFVASSQLPEGAQQDVQDENGKYKIASEELPKGVKQALRRMPLKDLEIKEAYIVEGTVQEIDPKPIYEVYFTDSRKKRTVARFYNSGRLVAGKK